MKKTSIRSKIKEVAKEVLIDPTETFYEKVEEEMEKLITPEFLEKVRTDLIKKPQRGRPTKREDNHFTAFNTGSGSGSNTKLDSENRE